MFFSRKNAALVAAFLAPSALAQTPAVAAQSPLTCANANTATFFIGAQANGGTVGDLALTVVVNTNDICTPVGATIPASAVGYRVTAANFNGTLGNAANTVFNPVTFQPAGASGDACFFPCNVNQYIDTAGLVFSTNNGANAYRLYQSANAVNNGGTSTYNLIVNSPNAGPSLVGPVQFTNSCKSPSNGAGFCAPVLSCNGGTVSYSTFTGQDSNGAPLTLNIGFNPNQICGQSPAQAGTTNPQGFQVTSLSGSYLNNPLLVLGQQAQGTACFYPCSAGVVDFQGITFQTQSLNNPAAIPTTFTFSYAPASGTTIATYRVTSTAAGTVPVSGTVAQSCNPGQADFFNGCAVSSSSRAVSSSAAVSSAAISVLPSISISIPSIVVPTISSSAVPASSAVVISTAVPTVSTTSNAVISSAVIATSGTAAVTSAPASVTGTSATTTAAASSSIAVVTGPQTSLPTPFVITVNVRVSRKRQAVQYVGDGGALTTDPTAAAIFQLINGQLFSDGAIVSTGPQIPAQQPLDGGAQGTVSTVWTSTNGAITWSNAVFFNGAATFCVANNIVNTVFVAAPAVGCVPVALTGVAASAVIPAIPTGAAAGGITINNNFNPTIGVIVTVNLVLGTSTLTNGSVITTTGLSSTTSPLYATASGNAYCLPCHMSAVGVACPSSGNVVYTTACGACVAYTAPAAVAVTCGTCVPVTLPAGTATAAPVVAPVATPAGTAGAAPVAPAFTGAAAAFGVEAAAVLVAGAALLL